MKRINFFIGADNKTKRINKEYYNKIIVIFNKYFVDYSINKLLGFWQGKKEESINIFIFKESVKGIDLNKIATELKEKLNQEAILMSIENIKTMVV